MLFGARLEISADVDLDGEAYRVVVPRPKGVDACLWALGDEWWHLFPGSLPDDERAYWQDRLKDPTDPLTRAMLVPIAHKLAVQVYGVPWWTAHRMLEQAAESHLAWSSWCVSHGFRPEDEPADRIIASILGWVSANWDDESAAKSWSQKVFMRPKNARG